MLLVTQTIKCIRFFEFAAKHTEFSKMVPLFCQKYGLDNKWWCYPKAIWELECIFNSHIGEIDFAKCKMPDDNITYRVAIESSLDVNDFVSKKENRDFTKFRSRPLIRMDETRFFCSIIIYGLSTYIIAFILIFVKLQRKNLDLKVKISTDYTLLIFPKDAFLLRL